MNVKIKNAGMSLVELMISVAILSIIMIAIGWMLSSMSKSFGNSQREVALQDSVQTTYSVISGLIKESQAVYSTSADKVGTTGYPAEDEYPNVPVWVDSANSNRVYIAAETSKRDGGEKVSDPTAKVYIVEYVPSDKKLYLGDTTYTPSEVIQDNKIVSEKYNAAFTSVSIKNDNNLLSRNVESFSVNTRKLDKGYVIVDISLANGSRKAQITQNVYLRNSGISTWSTEEKTPAGGSTGGAGEGGGTNINDKVTLKNKGKMPNPDTDDIERKYDIFVGYDCLAAQSIELVATVYDWVETDKIENIPENAEVNVETIYDYDDKLVGFKCACGATKLPLHNWGITKIQCTSCWAQYELDVPWKYSDNDDANQYDELFEVMSKVKNLKPVTEQIPVPKGEKYYYATSSHEDVRFVDTNGRLVIKNDSESTDYESVSVTIYFDDDVMFNELYYNSNSYLALNRSLTTGEESEVQYYYSSPEGGKCKYIKILIPKLKKAKMDSDTGKVNYDAYVFEYNTDRPTSEVACVFNSTGIASGSGEESK